MRFVEFECGCIGTTPHEGDPIQDCMIIRREDRGNEELLYFEKDHNQCHGSKKHEPLNLERTNEIIRRFNDQAQLARRMEAILEALHLGLKD